MTITPPIALPLRPDDSLPEGRDEIGVVGLFSCVFIMLCVNAMVTILIMRMFSSGVEDHGKTDDDDHDRPNVVAGKSFHVIFGQE